MRLNCLRAPGGVAYGATNWQERFVRPQSEWPTRPHTSPPLTVLTEFFNVRQIAGDPRRRWFQSANEDLIVWYASDGSILGFQLCYDRPGTERALTWFKGEGYSHRKVDDGENVGLSHKRTPILVADGIFDSSTILTRFLADSKLLPAGVVAFVSAKLHEYPGHDKDN